MPEPIRLYLDFASPYAYFALDAADRLAAMQGRTLVWRPILVWAVLKAQGVAPPMEAPAKRAYFLADMKRSAEFYGLPYAAPELPLSSHKVARLYHALEARDAAAARTFGRAVFSAFFAERRDIADAEVLVQLAASAGVREDEARADCEGALGRERLAAAIEEATAAGVCGSPWFLVDGEAFFGADRLPQIAWRLGDRRDA